MTLATVTMRLRTAASFTPRWTRYKNSHTPTVDSATASSVSPSPSAGAMAPTVDMISTQ